MALELAEENAVSLLVAVNAEREIAIDAFRVGKGLLQLLWIEADRLALSSKTVVYSRNFSCITNLLGGLLTSILVPFETSWGGLGATFRAQKRRHRNPLPPF